MLIPLLPLRIVLFPYARIPLQIFEPRYLDMIKYCMKADKPFGIVRICNGSEVINPGVAESLDIEFIGCTARIVDFDTNARHQLQIVVEGQQRFRIKETSVAADQLISAEVELLKEPAPYPLPEKFIDLAAVLEGLLQYPVLASLNHRQQLDCAVTVAYQLAAVMPFETEQKQELLELQCPDQRLETISNLIKSLSQDLG